MYHIGVPCLRCQNTIAGSASAFSLPWPLFLYIRNGRNLLLLVEKYEMEHQMLGAPDSAEAIKFRMEQMNLKQTDIAPLFGGRPGYQKYYIEKDPGL